VFTHPFGQIAEDPFFRSRLDQIVALANRTVLTGSSWFAGERLP
jgi:hypothetical protein